MWQTRQVGYLIPFVRTLSQLCNQHNNSDLCVKYIFLSLDYASYVVWCTSKIYPWR